MRAAASIELILSDERAEVERRIAAGYCPVECSIDGLSLVDDLVMDHHGARAHLESVALRAYRDHHGARAADPRFVGVGTADADMTFAVAALAGLLPAGDAQLLEVASLIARLDTEPIGLDLTRATHGPLLLAWHALAGQPRASLDATAAVYLWRTLLATSSERLSPLLEAACAAEAQRVDQARADLARGALRCGPVLAVDDARVWGFDVWYGRRPEQPFARAAGWAHPVVLALSTETRAVTIGCPCVAVARELFGPRGLLELLPRLDPPGWGGREAIGGSPRGLAMRVADLERAARQVADLLDLGAAQEGT